MEPSAPSGANRTSGLAIAALVCGILCCVPIVNVAAIAMGIFAIVAMRRDPSLAGKGMAIAGVVLGTIGVVLWIVAVATGFWGIRAIGRGFRRVRDQAGIERTRLHLVDLRTRQTETIAPFGDTDHCPDWSPDGRSIVFVSRRAGRGRLAVLDVQTRRAQTLPGEEARAWNPETVRYRPDGAALAVGARGEIHFLDLTPAAQPRRLGAGMMPAWSRDGTRLAFAVIEGLSISVVVAPAGGGPLVRLSPQGVGSFDIAQDLTPDWSPLGDVVVGSSRGGGLRGLWLFGTTSAAIPPRPLYVAAPDAVMPRFSRDGSRIAFGSMPDSTTGLRIAGPSALRILTLSSGQTERVADLPGMMTCPPSFSPDGTRLVVSAGTARPPRNRRSKSGPAVFH